MELCLKNKEKFCILRQREVSLQISKGESYRQQQFTFQLG